MNPRRWLNALVLLVALLAMWTASYAQAQPPCPYATIRLDTDQSVDVDAICDAARPWADEGIHIFIFLTDRRTESEDDWFALLDQVEEEVGIRGADGFDKNVLAFEAGAAGDQSWAYSVTRGELLYDSPLDADTAVSRIKSQMRNGIAAGDPTGAFVQALNTAYEINHPAAPPPTAQPLSAAPTAQPLAVTEPELAQPSPLMSLVKVLVIIPLVILAVGGLGAGGYLLYRRLDLKRHQEALRTRTSNLLNACQQLLQGDTPEETPLYQLFRAYGGEHYKDVRADVREWLRRCQGALDDAFDLRKKLLDPAAQKKRSPRQTVQDWEMLYVTFVGNSERILELTDDELRTLLDPLLTLEREAQDAQLLQQLDGLRRELAGGMGLKVELRMVDPAQTDAEGILGYIDQIKAQIARLQKARREAPERLVEAQARRQATGKEVSPPFEMTEKQLFAGIDECLAQAGAGLEQGVFLRVIEQAAEVVRDLETVESFITAVAGHEGRQAEIDAITDQGYRPDRLPDDLKEVETDLKTVAKKIKAGDYVAAASWVEELNTDSQRALASAQAWQALHEQNTITLRQFGDELTRVEGYRTDEAALAWETLQTYPQGNWADVAEGLDQATQTLKRLKKSLLQMEQLNSMERQRFNQTETALAQASTDLAQAERQLEAVVHRLAEVRAAEEHIVEALRLTEDDIAKTAALRDQEDVKVGPEVDRQIGQAQKRLAEGQQLAEEREFIAATGAQTAARELATAAHAAAGEQVQEINALQADLEALAPGVSEQVEHCQVAAQALPAVVQTAATNKLVQQLLKSFSKAQRSRTAATDLQDRALAKALGAALAAYEVVDQLADRSVQQIAADRDAYDRALTGARNAIHAAQSVIQKAKWVVADADARNAGSHTLLRAQKTLSQIGSTDDATREALNRILEQAQQAQQDAERAERLARAQISKTKAERRRWRQQRSSGGSFSFSFGSSSSSSSRGSSHRSSSSGSSHRSSSRGSSRRSSSRGGSRR